MPTLRLDPLPRNVTVGEIVRFVADTTPIDGKLIGKIHLDRGSARVELPDSHACTAVSACDGATFHERRVRASLLSAVADQDRRGPDHFDRLLHLLELEAEEERRRVKLAASERRQIDDPYGTSLSGLLLREQEFGLGGRLLLTFGRAAGAVPPNRLQPGSPVLVTQTGVQRPFAVRGVMLDRTESRLTVAIEEPDEDVPEDAHWRLDLSADEASRLRQAAALYRAQAAKKDRLAELRNVLTGDTPPEFTAPEPQTILHLNPSQAEAVAFALSAKDLAVIHGPPGTGKTTTIVEVIRRAVARGEKVLACAPSNAAVDNLLEKLLAVGLEPIRLGHPARVQPELRTRVLDLLVEKHPAARQAKKFVREATALFRQADKWTKAKPQPGEKQAARAEARDLLAEGRKLEEAAADQLLDEASVVCATLTGLDSETLGRRRFGLAIVDEACQSTEPACWIPLLRSDKVVLAGDPCQLPPTVLDPAADGLRMSLMERLMARFGPHVSRLLSVQYRMHEHIMAFSNAEFYDGKLTAHPSVVGHRLTDLPGVQATTQTEPVVTFLDTAGAGYDEELEDDTSSRRNRQEAKLAADLVQQLLAAGVAPAQVAVITPYAGQVRGLRELLADQAVEVDSVDGFQGREKEVVLMSFVRSNVEGEIGFLSEIRRTNVAMTRAKRLLIMIGDSATLAGHPFYQRLIEYAERIGAYTTVWEVAPPV